MFYIGWIILFIIGREGVAGEPPLEVPQEFTVDLAAGPELIAHPLMATFDHQGRLYVAASAGENLSRKELEDQLPNFVQRLEDVDGDGRFDKVTMFADKLTFPQGCLWWEGSLYVASSGAVWKFTDSDDDGIADERQKLVGDFGYTGNAADVHGPFAGPDGRIYWCEGRHGHEIKDPSGNLISRGKSARIFSCRPDGTDVQTYCAGGMDNPVEVVFLPNGEMLGTVNLMYSPPRGDCLVNWQFRGVYPREDFAQGLDAEFQRTGPLLPELHNFGHVAVSGLCRLEQPFPDSSDTESLLITQFNTNRVVRAVLARSDSGELSTKIEDFVVSSDRDFHPTDVLEDADGSLLVIDTGGWFRIGCPQSGVAKSDLLGSIYRIRSKDSPLIDDPRGTSLDWNSASIDELVKRLDDTRPAVRDQAIERIAVELRRKENLARCSALSASMKGASVAKKQCWIRTLARIDQPVARKALSKFVEDPDAKVRELAIRSLLYAPVEEFDNDDDLYQSLLASIQSGLTPENRLALATLGQLFAKRPEYVSQLLQVVRPVPEDPNWRHAFVAALIASNDRKSVNAALFHSDEVIRLAAADALVELRRSRPDISELVWMEFPAASLGQKLNEHEQEQLLDLATSLPSGDVKRGKEIFRSSRIGCITCHRIGAEGGLVGPDLSTIGRSRSPTDLLESILYPSATFARGFAPYQIVTQDGRVFAGIVLAESHTHVKLGVDKEKSVSIPYKGIEEIYASGISIMPADVAKNLNSTEIADLIAYLQSLK